MSDNQLPENSEPSPLADAGNPEIRQMQLRAAVAARAAEIRKEVLIARTPAERRRWKLPALPVRLPALPVQTIDIARRAHAVRPRNRLFLWTVALPTLLAVIYFGAIASDVYVAESAFVVRSAQSQGANALGALSMLQGTGLLTSDHDDTYAVESYIQSMDAVRALDLQIDLRKQYGDKHIDFVKRLGAVFPSLGDESLLRYYRQWIVDLTVDSSSSIVTLTTRAFSADDAYRINEMLLGLSEDLVNRMNARARDDLVGFAQRDVDLAEARAKQARLALAAYRNEANVLNPELEGGVQLQELARLQADLVAAKAALAQLEAVAPENPQILPLKKHIEALQAGMNAQNKGVAGDLGSLAHKAAGYDQVELEREYADKELAEAQALLQQAKTEALNKQLYLERIVQPARPTTAWEPRRLKDIISTFLLGTVVWMVLTLLIHGVREHGD
jgi:capsular polysaccharide transport system permease protein